jgi:hypothetical protein
MTHLPELIAAYACMSPWARGLIRELALGYAMDFPAPKADGSLRIGVESTPNNTDKAIDSFPLVVVSKPVDG